MGTQLPTKRGTAAPNTFNGPVASYAFSGIPGPTKPTDPGQMVSPPLPIATASWEISATLLLTGASGLSFRLPVLCEWLTVDARCDRFTVVSAEAVGTSTLPAVLRILVAVAHARPRQPNTVRLAYICTIAWHPADNFHVQSAVPSKDRLKN